MGCVVTRGGGVLQRVAVAWSSALFAVVVFVAFVVCPPSVAATVKTAPDTQVAPVGGHLIHPSARTLDESGGPVVNDADCQANVLGANDDGSTGEVALPFTLNFFGTNYSSLWVNNNGNVTFSGPQSRFTPYQIDASTPPIIAPFFADVDTRGAGSGLVTYGTTTFEGHQAFCVDWPDVGYFSSHTDKLNTFQLLLVDRSDVASGDFDIVFNYDQIQWETGDASGGVGGLGGTSAGAGFSNGDGNADHFFQLAGSLQNGAFLDSNAQTGLTTHDYGSPIPGRYIFHVTGSGLGGPGGDVDLSRPWPSQGYGYSFANQGLSTYLGASGLAVGDVLTSARLHAVFADWGSVGPTAAQNEAMHNLFVDSDGGVCFGLALSGGRFDAGIDQLADTGAGRTDPWWAAAGTGPSATTNLPAPGASGTTNAYDRQFLGLIEGDFVSQYSRQVYTSLQQQHFAYSDPTSGFGALENQVQSVMGQGIDLYDQSGALTSPAGGTGFALIQINAAYPTIQGTKYVGHEVLAYSAETLNDGTLQIDVWDNNYPDVNPVPGAIDVHPNGEWTYNEQYPGGDFNTLFSMSGAPGDSAGGLAVFPLFNPTGLSFNPSEAGAGLGSGAYVDVTPGSDLSTVTDGNAEPVDIEALASETSVGNAGDIVDLPSGSGSISLSGTNPSLDVRGPDTYMTAQGGGSGGSTQFTTDAQTGSIGTNTAPGALTVSRGGQQIETSGVGTLSVGNDGSVTTTGDSGDVVVTIDFDNAGVAQTATLYSGPAPSSGQLGFTPAQITAAKAGATAPATTGPGSTTSSSPGNGTTGSRSSRPTTAQVRAALARLLAPRGREARIAKILRNGGYKFTFTAPSAGRLVVVWDAASAKHSGRIHAKRKVEVIARAALIVKRSGTTKVAVKLTATGRSLLKSVHRLKLSARASFTPIALTTTVVKKDFMIRR
jgi:hypothetical protein